MKKFALLLAFLACSTLSANEIQQDITSNIPEISISETYGFDKIPDVAQYKNADWSQVVGIARGVPLSEACRIAELNPEITFFFYTKGYQMVLETEDGDYRVFHQGDAVFFTGEPWWGSAPGLADGYVRYEPEIELR